MKRIRQLKFNVKVVLITVIFIALISFIFLIISINYVDNNMLQDEKNGLVSNSTLIENDILKKIETIDLIGSYITDDGYLKNYLTEVYSDTVSLKTKLEFLDSNMSGLESVININNNIDYIRIYSTNNQVTELLPTLYSSARIPDILINAKGWKVNYQINIFSNDDRLIGHFYDVFDDFGNKIAIVEISISIENMFYENNYAEIETIIFHEGFFDKSIDNVSQLISETDLQENTTFTKGNYLFNVKYLKEIDSYVINYKDLSNINNSIMKMIGLIIFAILVMILFLALIINYVIKRLFKRFYCVVAGIEDISEGNLDTVILIEGNDEISELANEVNELTSSFKEMMQRNIEIEVSDKESRIRALQSQINAHFIYNTLESIKMMAEIEEKYDISDALTSLGKLLRYSMKWSSGLVVLENELNYIKAYLSLAELRFDYKIFFEVDLETEILEQVIPKMTLQPLIENSINYGTEDQDLHLLIKGYYVNDECFLEVIDSGYGMANQAVVDLQNKIDNGYIPDSKGSGIALVNINRRIKVQFGEKYGLKVESEKNKYTKIIINLPATRRIKGG